MEFAPPGTIKKQALTRSSVSCRHRRREVPSADAAVHVQELRGVLERDDPVADERRNRATRWRTIQQQGVRVSALLEAIRNLSRKRPTNS